MSRKIATIVLTYNRKNLLKKCLQSLLSQTKPLDKIFIVDNDSKDGTNKMIKEEFNFSKVEYINIKGENIGPAACWAPAIKKALKENFAWLWLMDDDAEPLPDTLKNLFEIIKKQKTPHKNTYAPIPIDKKGRISWITNIYKNGKKIKVDSFEKLSNLKKDTVDSFGVGFIGGLYPRNIIQKVGFPNKDFFIRGDEIEYNYRVKEAGFGSKFVLKSRIYHPRGKKYKISLFGKKIYYSPTPAWKRYYCLRNTVFVHLRHHKFPKNILYFCQVVLKHFVFMIKLKKISFTRIKLYTKAIIEGIIGKLGKTIEPKDYE